MSNSILLELSETSVERPSTGQVTELRGRRSVRLDRLEAVRGAAAIYVVIGHVAAVRPELGLPGWLLNSLRFGQEAVMAFFLLSGFVIAFSWDSSRGQSWAKYFQKRFVRIYSVWCVAVLATAAAMWIEVGEPVVPGLDECVGNVLMLQDFSTGKPATICDPIFGNTPLWSLH